VLLEKEEGERRREEKRRMEVEKTRDASEKKVNRGKLERKSRQITCFSSTTDPTLHPNFSNRKLRIKQ